MMPNKMVVGILLYAIHASCMADCIKTVVLVRHGEKNITTPHGQLDCQGLNRALALSDVLTTDFGTPAAIYAPDPNVTVADGSTTCYTYQRPLATIEPIAIALDMQVLSTFGVGNIGGPASPEDTVVPCADAPPEYTMLQLPQAPSLPGTCGEGSSAGDMDLARAILNTSAYCGQTIFVAWEHRNIPIIAYAFYNLLGINPVNAIPLWPYAPCSTSYAEQGFCSIGNCSANYNFDTIYTVTINQSSIPPRIQIVLSSEHLNDQSTDCPT